MGAAKSPVSSKRIPRKSTSNAVVIAQKRVAICPTQQSHLHGVVCPTQSHLRDVPKHAVDPSASSMSGAALSKVSDKRAAYKIKCPMHKLVRKLPLRKTTLTIPRPDAFDIAVKLPG